MRVLVTGGAGFLGSHLVERLVAAAAEVVVLDDLSTGDLRNLGAVMRRIAFEEGCVTDSARVAALARTCDLVVHLASTVGVERVAADPHRTRTVIETGTENVLGAGLRAGARVVTISSSEVYGFAPPCPVREEELPYAIEGRAPRLAYARAKLAADQAALARARRGEQVLVVRPFNLVGPRQDGDGGAVLPRFVRAALAGEDLVVHGDGSQRRAFLDVRDAAELLVRVLPRREVTGALNLGGIHECSMFELARAVVARTGSTSRVVFAPPPASRGGVEIARRVPCVQRLREVAGGVSAHSLTSSIDAAVAALRAPTRA